jgi:hypothetical protein
MLRGMAGCNGIALLQMIVHAFPPLAAIAMPVPVLPFLGDARRATLRLRYYTSDRPDHGFGAPLFPRWYIAAAASLIMPIFWNAALPLAIRKLGSHGPMSEEKR